MVGRTRRLLLTTCVGCAAVVFAQTVELVDDPPVVAPPKPGKITGRIAPAEAIASLRAVSRQTQQQYEPATLDKATGRFEFADLPGDAAYDLCIVTRDGREIEGIDLDFVDARLERLAEIRRRQLGLPERPKTPFTPRDVEAIRTFVAEWRDFLDTRRILYIRGHGDRAVVLVELMRSREFHESHRPGQDESDVVWRIELWYFRKHNGVWQRLPNVERILHRLRAKPQEWRKVGVEFFPELTARIDAEGKSDPVRFTIPAKSDPSRGRPADTPPKLDTKPYVDGLDSPGEEKENTNVTNEDRISQIFF